MTQRTTATPPPWLDEVQKPPGPIPADADRPPPLLFNDDEAHRPITTVDGWKARANRIASAWRTFLGEIPRPANPPRFEVLEDDEPAPGLLRQLVRYEAEPGLPVEGYLVRPRPEPENSKTGKSRPGVVVLHSTVDHTIRQPAGLEGEPNKHLGLHLARRGFVAFCPRCYLWQYGRPGHIEDAVDWLRQRHPRVKGMAKMLFDAIRGVDLVASLPEVDPGRIGAIGHSLGAKEVLYLAAFDPRVRASVSSEGGIGLGYSNWDAPWYLGPEIRRPGFPLNHAQLLALVAPRAFLLIGGDSADGSRSWPYIEAVRPVWELTGAPQAVGLFDHHQGHEVPPIALDRSLQWLEFHLSTPAPAPIGLRAN
jgi:dienelactone hydrolase